MNDSISTFLLSFETEHMDHNMIACVMMSHKQSMYRWLKDACFDRDTYCRKTLFAGHGFEIVVIGWLPGQYSLIHDHGASCGAVMVLDGECTEDHFRLDHHHNAIYCRSSHYVPGDVATVELESVHRVGNSSKSTRLITLHVYTPPLAGKASLFQEKTLEYA